MKTFTLFLLILPFLGSSQIQVGQDIDGEAIDDWSGGSLSLSGNGTVVAIGSERNDDSGEASGHVRVFENQSGTWTQIGQDIDGESENYYSSRSVGLSYDGRIVAIGAPGYDLGRGQVKIYEYIEESWTQIGSIDGEGFLDNCGTYLSLSNDGNVLAIGAPLNRDNGDGSGHVRVFENQSGIWTQIGQDLDGENIDDTAANVSISGNGFVVAFGAPWNDGNGQNSGQVRIYEYVDDTWIQIGDDIYGEAALDNAAIVSLSIDGSIVAIGGPFNNNHTGHVRVFENQSGTWTQIGQDLDGEAENDRAGGEVSLSGDGTIVALGAPGNDGNGNNSGHVRVYQNQSDVWVQIGSDIEGETVDDFSSASLSLSSDGSLVAIGAPNNDGNGTMSGHVRIYDLSALLSADEEVFNGFNLYPNPTNNLLHIEANDTITLVKVYNLLGQQMLTSSPNSLTEELDMSEFNPGVYLVKVVIGGKTATYKVVKK